MALSSATARSVPLTLAGLLGLALLLLVRYGPDQQVRLTAPRPSTDVGSEPPSVVEGDDAWSAPMHQNHTGLRRRDDFSCGPGRPCSNGACCGAGGYCGYGPTYCGAGCVSNCGAVAECGKDASPPGKTCPLNTCCSQYGFCGTTEEFCDTDCQSNCVLHPKPPGGGGGDVLKNVIGYYESWSARLACHRMTPADLPLDGLTHLNYAFAYIDPSSFRIVTMDPETPVELFQEVVDVKKYKSDLKVWLSVGGWTFSDNGTATQPVFGNIASTPANRQKFADNAMRFMNHYGYDGLDIDWEYPGAPDRGGRDEDTENFVLLMKTLRSTFDRSPRRLGITFTAPSSFWYLRWFDLPGLLKYSDWINIMTYDLHGVWDRNNPIGSIVQAHTNLTEIELALELFWRVDIPPSKLYMGFGFYGRAFELADPSCTKPGCQFRGGSTPGPCSSESGILMYYEIMAMLKQHPELSPIHDKAAAVKYVVFDDNQWVSYDDGDTFKQKVEWANDLGLGGSLIWATDTDDDEYSAHSGLLDKEVGHVDLALAASFKADSGAIAQSLIGSNGQDCKVVTDCTDQDNPQASDCDNGYTKLGWEKGDCGSGYGRSICCPSATAPNKCIWRGSGGDCNGQCHPGEATVLRSSRGGHPTTSNQRKCSRGKKVFCCEAGEWENVIAGCRWTGCGGDCKDDEEQVSTKYDSGPCLVFSPTFKYCCPRGTHLYDCRWVGSNFDCPDAKCASDEVAIDLNAQGANYHSCSWGRKKTNCCKVSKPPPPTLQCTASLCDFDSGLCAIGDGEALDLAKRDLSDEHVNILEKRGGRRQFPFSLAGLADTLYVASRAYPSRGQLFATQAALRDVVRRWWRIVYTRCDDSTVEGESLDLNDLPAEGETEHPIDLSLHARFIQSANSGRLPSGQRTQTPAIRTAFWRDTYLRATLPAGLPRVTDNGPDLRQPSDRVFEAFGSNTNRRNLILTERQINGVKGRLFTLDAPISTRRFDLLLGQAAGGDADATEQMIQELRTVIAVFRYLQDSAVSSRFRDTRSLIRTQLQFLEFRLDGATGLTAHWDEFFPDYMIQVEDFAQEWMTDRIRQIRERFSDTDPPPANAPSVLLTLIQLEGQISEMTIPTQDPPEESEGD